VEVRVRRRAGRSTLTVKSGPAHVRVEEELDIDDRRFEALWALTEGRRIAKTRHLVPLEGGVTAEVDVYGDALAGVVTAEIEFASTEASAAFIPPDWLGTEVTGDARYANQSLALAGVPG
jgi:CYTH domain-containing protein